MKVLCDVCERSEASVLCCADEAALCWQCDDVVHAANKLARKHQRVPLLPRLDPPSSSSSSSPISSNPLCDICQEKAGYFFCLEDRALLCRNCDVAIHTATPHVSKHQRFLITGVRVEVQHYSTSHRYSTSQENSSNNNGINCQAKIAPMKEQNSKNIWTDFDHAHGDAADGLRSPWGWSEVISEPGSSGLTGSKGSF